MSRRGRQVVALFLSGIFPGLGQFYNHEPYKGAGFVGAGLLLSWLLARAVPADPLAMNPFGAELILPLIVLLAVWGWSLVDAWHGAHA